MRKHFDALIVGAGPAGLSAAVAARACGLDVAVVDEQPHMGGQLFRNIHLPSGRVLLDGHDLVTGKNLLGAFAKSGAHFFPQTTVWGLNGSEACMSHNGVSTSLTASKILFAVGGMERPVPFKGWTLPGVMTAGAAEILMRSAMPVCPPHDAVVLAGNGPLLLSLAGHLIDAGVPIAAWLDTGHFSDKLQSIVRMGAVYKDIPYFMRGVHMAMKILRHKIPFVTHVTHIEALGDGRLERVRYKKRGQWHDIVTSTLLRHENIIPRTHIASALGMDLLWEKTQRYWHPVTDMYGHTSLQDIYMCGDGAFVYGGEAAVAQGHVTGIAMALDLGVIDRGEAEQRCHAQKTDWTRLCEARMYLRKVFAPNPAIYVVPDETLVCRCEHVSAADIRRAVAEGFTTPDEVKRFTRCGMGACQGRMCAAALAEIVAQEHGCAVDTLALLQSRQPFAPVTLGDYCELWKSSC